MTTSVQSPDYIEATDCLISLFDATVKLTSTAARGKQFSKSDFFEVGGLVQIMKFMAEACHTDLDGAYDASVEGGDVDPRRADRALIALNDRLVKSLSYVMLARTKKTAEARQHVLDGAFDRFNVRHLYAIVLTFAVAAGVKVEG